MDILDCMKKFASWPVEVQSACVYQFQNRPVAIHNPEHSVKKQKNRNSKRWSDDERLELFELFDRFGWDKDLALSWAKRFGRKVSAIRGQFDHEYRRWKSKSEQA